MSKVALNPSKTNRGFDIYDEFKDGYRNTVRVTESSSTDGGIWIFCSRDNPGYDAQGCKEDPSPYLTTLEQVDRLIAALKVARNHLKQYPRAKEKAPAS